jgi:pyruvate dehydrogenase E1 component beta subunit
MADYWLDYLGGARRPTVTFDTPVAGSRGEVPDPIAPVPFGTAATRRAGNDIALISVGVGVHRSLEAAEVLAAEGVDARVIDLRSVSPVDVDAIASAATATGRVVVVDEDYIRGGLSGEIAAIIAEHRIDATFARVAVESTIPYARPLEYAALPNVERILAASRTLS